MNAQDALSRLSGMLKDEGQGRYHLICDRSVLLVRLVGASTSLRFASRDHVAFRIDAANLTIEDVRTHAKRVAFRWSSIESVAAGEAESDNSDLFQG